MHPYNYKSLMEKLESFGTTQNRKIYKRHGAGEKMFGVSFANLNKLKKEIKQDHDLALQLWASGNIDAKTFATMICEPEKFTSKQLDNMVKVLDYYLLVDVFVSNVVSKSKFLQSKVEKWTKSKNEWVGSAGWISLAYLSRLEESLENVYFSTFINTIEDQIHSSKNRTKHSMNSALISIGLRNSSLEKIAVAAAKVIGKIDVDHGETSCKTPDAIEYIKKTKTHRRSK